MESILGWLDSILPPVLGSDAQLLYYGRDKLTWKHVILEWYPPVLLIRIFDDAYREELQQAKDVVLKIRDGIQSVVFSFQQKGGPELDYVGQPLTEHIVTENKLQYWVKTMHSQNTGLFLDMRSGRQWVKNHAKDKRVLNLFAYTCGFSVSALAGGASFVYNWDMKSFPLSLGKRNHQLNRLDMTKVAFYKHDIRKSYGKIQRLGLYDIIIADPPPRQASFSLHTQYPQLLLRMVDNLTDSGEILAWLNDFTVSKTDFLSLLQPYFLDKAVRIEILEFNSLNPALQCFRITRTIFKKESF